MFRLLAACLLIFCIRPAFTQDGDFPITHHTSNIKGLEFTTYDLTFDQFGLMYVATNSGILRYDGVYWDFITTPAATFSVMVGENNHTFIGAMGGFGELQLSDSGLQYVTISPDSLKEHQFRSIVDVGDSLLFVSDQLICSYQPRTGNISYFNSPDKWPIEAVVKYNGDLFITTRIATYFWKGNEMREAELFDGELPVKVIERSGNLLMLSHAGKLFTLRSDKLTPIHQIGFEIEDFKWVNDSVYVVSSRNEGSRLLNYNTQKVIGTINYKSGLPDNEISAIEVDWNDGIWIAHQFGFSRVDPNSPIECLSNEEGLEGNLIASTVYQGKVLLGTSSGLFRPVVDSVYEMKETATRLQAKGQKKTSSKPILKEVRWVYQRIPGISNKVNALQKHAGKLLVGTNEGLFSYDGYELVKIVSDPVSKINSLPRTNEFLVVDDFKVSRYTYSEGEYTELPFGLEDQLVVSVFGDRKSLVWLVGTDKLQAAGLTYQGASVLSEVSFPNKFMETPTICELDKGLYFITSQGFFKYDYQQKSLKADSVMESQLGKPVQHLIDPEGGFWMYDGKLWKHINRQGESFTYPYLSLFPDLRYIHQDGDAHVYFINSDNKFYHYTPEEKGARLYSSNIFYKHLFAKSAYTPYLQQVSLDYDQNYLRAEVGQPDYLGLLKVEYQYQLEGMDDGWSEWSDNNRINLNFLPEGKYTLQVRSRDVFGRMQTIDPITLVVDPPYWQTTWFYFLEVVFFASLVLISTRLNQGKASNRFLTEGLTVLTIVVIIETLQSAAGSYIQFATSPFIDFLINLCIALVIFPLELLLKKIIKSGKVPVKLKGVKNNGD